MGTDTWTIEGSSEPRVVAAGHSHILSLLGGLHSSTELQQQPLAIQYSMDRKLWPNIGEDYWQNLQNLPSVETVVICWNGNQHNAQFLLESEPSITVHQDSVSAGASDENCLINKKSGTDWDTTS